jgi:cytoskeleton protein RodZ
VAVVEPRAAPAAEAAVEPPAAKKDRVPVSEAVRGLRFVFNGESWVEVRDGEGKVLYSKTNAAGTERRVRGDPPFSVVVGGAANVQLTYDGTLVDLMPYSANDVARLQLE